MVKAFQTVMKVMTVSKRSGAIYASFIKVPTTDEM